MEHNNEIEIISNERKLVGNKVIETVVRALPRYSLCRTNADYYWENDLFGDMVREAGLLCFSIGHKWLNNTDFTSDTHDKYEDYDLFSKYVKENYKDKEYDIYVLQEYRHSGSYFYLVKTLDNIDRWDSGVVGFIAMPKTESPSLWANRITDVYEGTVDLIEVIDNETDDVEYSFEYWSNSTELVDWNKKREHILKEYGLDIDNVY